MRITLSIALGATLLASGCATVPAGTQPVAYDNGIDYEKVAAIDRTARVNGLEIHWVNMPQRRAGTAPAAAPVPLSSVPTGT